MRNIATDQYNWEIYSRDIQKMLFYAPNPAMKHMSRLEANRSIDYVRESSGATNSSCHCEPYLGHMAVDMHLGWV